VSAQEERTAKQKAVDAYMSLSDYFGWLALQPKTSLVMKRRYEEKAYDCLVSARTLKIYGPDILV
jgi:hypothetical protein